MYSVLSTFNTTTEVPLSKAPNPQLLPGVFTVYVCVCSLLCVCVCSLLSECVCSRCMCVCVHCCVCVFVHCCLSVCVHGACVCCSLLCDPHSELVLCV